MTKSNLFNLQSTHNSNRFFLPVEKNICVGPPGNEFLFGGVGLGAAITAMEQSLDRPVVWATSQYLSYAQPGSIVDIDVIAPKVGKSITQARVIGHVGDREIFTVNAALGRRDMDLTQQWITPKDVPGPDDCQPVPTFDPSNKDLHSRFDIRVARGRWGWRMMDDDTPGSEDGNSILWARLKEDFPVSAGWLAILADYVPGASAPAIGKRAGANSLDNTIRILRPNYDTEWVMCDLRIYGVKDGFVHGRAHLFAEDGVLLATASQSAILRIWEGDTRPAGPKKS